jgi:hypothetical protein
LEEKNKFWKLRNNGSIAGCIKRVKIGIIVAISAGGDDYTPKRTKHKNGNSEPNFAIFFSFTNTNVTKINKSITKVLKNVNI